MTESATSSGPSPQDNRTGATTPANPAATKQAGDHLALLDGWRASSILLVIAGHWLPLNAVLQGLNDFAALLGMAIFFTLSGFLITRFLIDRPEPGPFLVRRVMRILPLAWLAMFALFFADRWAGEAGVTWPDLIANLAFYANLPPTRLMPGGEHLWSLCVEMYFYIGIALLVMAGGRRALYLLPLLALAFTAGRVAQHATVSIFTWQRIDEILAGATLSLVYHGMFGPRPAEWLSRINFYVIAAIAVVVTFFDHTALAYLRPYGVAAMVGVTLYHAPGWLRYVFCSRAAAYIAKISYALYVFHVMFAHSWLGSGDTLVKYAKRPLLMLVTWAAAHVSTFYYEKPITDYARRLTKGGPRKPLRTY